MATRKEEKPDARFDTASLKGDTIGLDNPDYNYRVIYKDKQMEEYNRYGRHEAKGYKKVAEDSTRIVVACKKELREAREKAAQDQSERFLVQTGGNAVTGSGFSTAKDSTEIVANSAIDD